MPPPESTILFSYAWSGRPLVDEVLADFQGWKETGVRRRLPLLDDVIADWVKAKAVIDKRNRDYGVSFNPLRQIKIPETTHSRLLGDLLNPRGTHGQGGLFLRIFLKMLDPSFSAPLAEDAHWKVAVETGRVDILIWCDEPHETVIVIENKSNNAGDQQNQIYRYWHQEMYCRDRTSWPLDEKAKIEHGKAPFHLVYLPTTKEKSPASHSTERPMHWSEKDNPFPRVPLECQTVSLPELTRRWVEAGIPAIPKDNTRLRDFITQYHELWQI